MPRTAVSPGKHAANRLRDYAEIHRTILYRYAQGDFVLEVRGLDLEPMEGHIAIVGEIRCLGGIVIEVRKRLIILTDSGADSLVRTQHYRYHARLANGATILRYEASHPHRLYHHVHRHDPFREGNPGQVEPIHDEEDIPHLSEVIDEVRQFDYAHYEAIQSASAGGG